MVEVKEQFGLNQPIQEVIDNTLVKEIISRILKEYHGFIDGLDQDVINKYKTLKLIYLEIKNKLDQVRKIQINKGNSVLYNYLSTMNSSLEKEKKKLEILLKFVDESDVGLMSKVFDNVWSFNSVLINQDLYESINEIIEEKDETVGKQLKEEVDNYIESIEEAESKAKKYLENYNHIEAYIFGNVLNINISKLEQEKPIRISDILKLEKEIDGLNIYCDYKDEVRAYKQEDRRYYEFKAGSYEISINWPIKDQTGKDFGCTVVVAVGANGVTNILKVEIDDMRLNKLAKVEIVVLAKQNKEVYIQGLSLSEALEKFLESNYQSEETARSTEKILTTAEQVQFLHEPEKRLINTLDT
ncbi:MAG: hypothetical protein PV340_01615 [Wolbachia sp.]|nr:hypothetical protein [Wolbachia sp.]